MKLIAYIIIAMTVFHSCKSGNDKQQTQVLITIDQIENKNLEDLRIMRNEIFAKHGYIFNSQDLKDYFSNFDWYEPKFKDVNSLLTETDKINIATIQKRENQLKERIKEESNSTQKEISDKYLLDGTYKIIGNQILLPKFEIELKLTESANKKLNEAKETIIVQAYFRGEPKDTTLEEYEDFGEFSIGQYRIELENERVAIFDSAIVSKDMFDQLADKNFEILINVFTGRRSSQYNLLDCDILQDLVLNVKDKRHVLEGKLIRE